MSSVATNMSLVSRRKSEEKRTQSEGSLGNCSIQQDHDLEVSCTCQQTDDVVCPPQLG